MTIGQKEKEAKKNRNIYITSRLLTAKLTRRSIVPTNISGVVPRNIAQNPRNSLMNSLIAFNGSKVNQKI